jgi:hypothetical protein
VERLGELVVELVLLPKLRHAVFFVCLGFCLFLFSFVEGLVFGLGI